MQARRLGSRRKGSLVCPVLLSVVTKLRATFAVFDFCSAQLYPLAHTVHVYTFFKCPLVKVWPVLLAGNFAPLLSCVPVKAASHSRKPKLLCCMYLLYIETSIERGHKLVKCDQLAHSVFLALLVDCLKLIFRMFSCTAEVRSVNFLQEQHSIYADTENNFTINHLLPSTVSSSFFPSLLHTNHLKIRHCVLSFCCCQGPKGQCYAGFHGQRRWSTGLTVGTCLCHSPSSRVGSRWDARWHHWVLNLRSGIRFFFTLPLSCCSPCGRSLFSVL